MEHLIESWTHASQAMGAMLTGVAVGLIISLYALGFFDREDD